MTREGARDLKLPSAAPGRTRADKTASVFDGIQSFGLVVLLFGLPVGEALKFWEGFLSGLCAEAAAGTVLTER